MTTFDGYNLQFGTVTTPYTVDVYYDTVFIHKENYSLEINVTDCFKLISSQRPSETGILLLQKIEQFHKDGMSWEMIKDYYEL